MEILLDTIVSRCKTAKNGKEKGINVPRNLVVQKSIEDKWKKKLGRTGLLRSARIVPSISSPPNKTFPVSDHDFNTHVSLHTNKQKQIIFGWLRLQTTVDHLGMKDQNRVCDASGYAEGWSL